MDLLAEFFLELLGEIVLEGGMSAASDCRRSRRQRLLILLPAALLFAAVFAGMAAGGAVFLSEGRLPAGIVLLLLDLALIACMAYQLHKILRTLSKK